MPTNYAAFLLGKGKPLSVAVAPYTSPGANEIVIKNCALAMNPVDWIKQDAGDIIFSWVKYPFVMGDDCAGTVADIGPNVTRFKIGDRVVGHAVGIDQRSNKSSEGAFQEYTVLRTDLVAQIPDSMSFESACVLPLALSTASCGLFMKDLLALDTPTTTPKRNGKTLLVWGGSTSVGCNAIQLATAAGYEVITTASPRNHAYLMKLGAVACFDYRSPTVVNDIIEAFKGRTTAGAIAIGRDSMPRCIDVMGACKGRKFVAQASVDLPLGGVPQTVIAWASFVISMLFTTISTALKSRMKGVSSKFILGSDLMANEVGAAIYERFLPEALAKGQFVAAPEAHVVGKGLESIQEALRLQKEGVSARKLVVAL